MRCFRAAWALSVALAAAGCGSGETGETTPENGTDDGIVFDVPAAPEGAVRLVTPTFEIEPGKEVFMCMHVPFDVKEDLYVNASIAYQPKGGHHSMLYYSPPGQEPPEDAPHECDNTSDMGNIRFVGVGTADGVGISLPGGIAMKVPAGAKLYTQSHYLNTTNERLTAQDVVDLVLIPADQVTQKAGAFTEIDLGLELPPNEETTRVVDCTAPRPMTVPWMIPHMHEQGFYFKLEVVKDGERKTVYESAWEETMRDHFPLVHFDPHIEISPSDRIITTCTWRNTKPEPLLFPAEMCATFMPFYPSPDGALLVCDETGEHFTP